MASKSLSEQLAELTNPLPTSHDPEDDIYEGESGRMVAYCMPHLLKFCDKLHISAIIVIVYHHSNLYCFGNFRLVIMVQV